MSDRRRAERRRVEARASALRWGRHGFRERRLGLRLDRELAPIGAVLHACRVRTEDSTPDPLDDEPGSSVIDHLVVAPNGIWVIVADHHLGRLGRVRVDGRRQPTLDGQVHLDPIRRATRLSNDLERVLYRLGLDWVEVHPTVCFTNARWGRVARELDVDGVRMTWGSALVDRVAVPGPILQRDARAVAARLRRALVTVPASERRRT
jgi:hypothetical protein